MKDPKGRYLKTGCVIHRTEWPGERVRLTTVCFDGNFRWPWAKGIYIKKDGTPDKRRMDQFEDNIGPSWEVEAEKPHE